MTDELVDLAREWLQAEALSEAAAARVAEADAVYQEAHKRARELAIKLIGGARQATTYVIDGQAVLVTGASVRRSAVYAPGPRAG